MSALISGLRPSAGSNINQGVHSFHDKALAPIQNCGPGNTELDGDLAVGYAFGRQQNGPRPQSKPLRGVVFA
jgi:hypothetical protein